MAITDAFDPYGAEIISPVRFAAPVPGWPATMVVTFQPQTFEALAARFGATYLAWIDIEEATGEPRRTGPGRVLTFSYAGQTLGTYLSPVGAPGTAAAMEIAIARGTTRFVYFGTCGALVDRDPGAGVIVPSAAYRDEGTSYHYAAPCDYIDVPTAERTSAVLRELGVAHTVDRVWTTDGFFRETVGNVARRVGEGCVAVDMEVAALAAVAQFRSVAHHQFLYTADSLVGATWDVGALGRLPAEPRAQYAQIAADLAVRA